MPSRKSIAHHEERIASSVASSVCKEQAHEAQVSTHDAIS